MASPAIATASSGSPLVWALQPGEMIERAVLRERYGGSPHGGITPSRTSPNVMIFSEAASGEQHGYFEGWREDGCFHYTGEGQRGDQQMKGGNAAILRHEGEGRALRLFDGARGRVAYRGEFALDAERPFYTTDAPESKTGNVRSVIVFRMRPLDTRARPSASSLDPVVREALQHVAVEQQWTEKAFVAPSRQEYEAERREQRLVLAFLERLRKEGHSVDRLKIVPPGEAKPLFCDLIDNTTHTLYEAKGTVERGAIRMAIGQLLDYARFVQPRPRLAVLVPARPRADLMELLASADVGVIWQEGRSSSVWAGRRAYGSGGAPDPDCAPPASKATTGIEPV